MKWKQLKVRTPQQLAGRQAELCLGLLCSKGEYKQEICQIHLNSNLLFATLVRPFKVPYIPLKNNYYGFKQQTGSKPSMAAFCIRTTIQGLLRLGYKIKHHDFYYRH